MLDLKKEAIGHNSSARGIFSAKKSSTGVFVSF